MRIDPITFEVVNNALIGVAEQMAATIPDANLVKLAGAAHLSNMEEAHEFSEAIHDFMHD